MHAFSFPMPNDLSHQERSWTIEKSQYSVVSNIIYSSISSLLILPRRFSSPCPVSFSFHQRMTMDRRKTIISGGPLLLCLIRHSFFWWRKSLRRLCLILTVLEIWRVGVDLTKVAVLCPQQRHQAIIPIIIEPIKNSSQDNMADTLILCKCKFYFDLHNQWDFE